MSDDMPVVFGMGDARRIDRGINAWERMVEGGPSLRRQWRQPVDDTGSSSGCGCSHSDGICDCPGDCFDLRFPAVDCPAITFGLAGVYHVQIPKKAIRLDSTTADSSGLTLVQTACLQVGSETMTHADALGVNLIQTGTTKTLCIAWRSSDIGADVYAAKYTMCQIGCGGPFWFDFVSARKITGGVTSTTLCDTTYGTADTTFCWPTELVMVAVECSCYDYNYDGSGGGGGSGCASTYPTTACAFTGDGTTWNATGNTCSGGCGCSWTQADLIALGGAPTAGHGLTVWCV